LAPPASPTGVPLSAATASPHAVLHLLAAQLATPVVHADEAQDPVHVPALPPAPASHAQ
jgi:hypothetical protein